MLSHLIAISRAMAMLALLASTAGLVGAAAGVVLDVQLASDGAYSVLFGGKTWLRSGELSHGPGRGIF
jgi:hypothetical protein